MCGIVGFTGAQNAAPILLEGLKKLEYRGYDSAGIAVMAGNSISVNKVTGRIANLCEKTDDGHFGCKITKKNRITEKITYNNDFFSETYC